ncbi:MAG: hypothetical protein ACRD8O_12225 [Bryobacteraceae bacterium]
MLDALAPIPEDALRRLLHAEGVPAALPYGGIRQSSFDELESSLIEMQGVYAAAVAAGDRERAGLCRSLVIQAKDRAAMLSRNPKIDQEKRRQKEEMRQWMLVWLENPEIFEVWVGLRKQAF